MEQLVRELSHELMSPYCPGRTIAACPSPQARRLEIEIAQLAQQGLDRAAIEQQLSERFGDRIGLANDPTPILVTGLVAAVTAVALALAVRRWTAGDRAGGHGSSDRRGPPSPAELGRLERELARLDEP